VVAEVNRATAKTTYPVWIMNGIGGHTFHHARTEPVPWWWRPSGALFDQFLGAAETEPVLAEWFLRRFSLLDSLHIWSRRRASSAAPSHTTCGCGGASAETAARHATKGHKPTVALNSLTGSARAAGRAVVGGHPGRHAALQRQ